MGAAALLAIAMIALTATALIDSTDRGIGDGGRSGERVVTGPVEGRRTATLDVVSGVTSVTVRGAALGDVLYRAQAPAGASVLPSVIDTGGTIQLHLNPTGAGGPAAVIVEVNQDVRWRIRYSSGSTSNTADLRAVRLDGVEYVGGVTTIDLTLPRPEGTVPVRMTGGASRFSIRAPAGVPVRVRASGGAGSVQIDGEIRSGVAGGTLVTQPGWDAAQDRIDVDNVAGVATVSVERY